MMISRWKWFFFGYVVALLVVHLSRILMRLCHRALIRCEQRAQVRRTRCELIKQLDEMGE
ncbi:MAG: hypothetical protein ACYCXT_00120 [Acidiferrobacteraceae bacterium]